MKRFIICLLLILQTFFAAYAGAAPAIPPRPAAGSGIYDRTTPVSYLKRINSKCSAWALSLTTKQQHSWQY